MPVDLVRKAARDKKRKALNRERLNKMKTDKGCVDCGYDLHAAALHFDHLPGFVKHRNVASMTSSWVRMMEEAEKCEIVCANCHAIRTAIRGGWH